MVAMILVWVVKFGGTTFKVFGKDGKKVLLNVDMASSVFLRGMPVLDYLKVVTQHDVQQNRNVLSEQNRKKFSEK